MVKVLDDLNEKEKYDPIFKAWLKKSTHNNISIILISQDYYELPKMAMIANCNMYHIFEPTKFKDFHFLNQVKASMDVTLKEFNL